jgi:hypothetical protein
MLSLTGGYIPFSAIASEVETRFSLFTLDSLARISGDKKQHSLEKNKFGEWGGPETCSYFSTITFSAGACICRIAGQMV